MTPEAKEKQAKRRTVNVKKYILASDCTLKQFLIDYYRFSLQSTESWDTNVSTFSRSKKSDSLKLYEATTIFIKDDERGVLRKDIPAGDSPDFGKHLQHLSDVAGKISQRYMNDLTSKEKDLFPAKKRKRSSAMNTTALYARQKKVRKEQRQPVPLVIEE